MKFSQFAFLLLFFLAGVRTPYAKAEGIQIIPKPNHFRLEKGHFTIPGELTVSTVVSGFEAIIPVFCRQLSTYSDFSCTKTSGSAQIRLAHSDSIRDSESYQLKITPKDIVVVANEPAGAFYGLQSLLQLIVNADEGMIPCSFIVDQPRYSWRGIMLDESRHFFGIEQVKQLLDYMALHKLNKFHWHLTDVPGWRIEIKKYPKLTTVGGIGNDHDPKAEARYYTQEEISTVVEYARERFIEIIPEIDMPGHAAAANRAYPEFSGGGSERYPEFTFHPGKEGTYQYLTDILREVSGLFPSEYIHIGGDEVHFGNHQWKTDPDVQKLMKTERLNHLKQVEQYFIRRMADSVARLGKKVIGWDEVIGSGIDVHSTLVMWWRHDKPYLLDSAIENGYELVMCPRIPLYFDFDQHDSHAYGRRWGGEFCDIEKVYDFPFGNIDGDHDKVIGMQANVWTERIQNDKRLDFMTFPRLSAMAEAAWSYGKMKSYPEFLERLKKMIGCYDRDGIYYFDPFDVHSHPEPGGIKK
ncbi:MAG: beta-N-acetylhexosaminidase [Cytophagales bacterium]|nr:beta-N-acetylhexosaminidase [Cytophagales bacterium]